jgi:Peptidase M50B-like
MASSSLSTDLRRISQVQVHLPSPVAVLIAIIVAGAAFLPDLWLVTRHITVMAHEGAHAITGSALGRQVNAIRFARTAEGVTELSRGGRAGDILVGAAGYFGPSVFGVGAAELIRVGHVIAVLWLSLIALVILMVPLRRSFGVLTVIGAFVLLFLFIRYTTVGTQVVGGYGLAWFMLVSGVRRVLEVGGRAGDAGILSGLTRIPSGFWSSFWLVGCIAALVFGAVQLV